MKYFGFLYIIFIMVIKIEDKRSFNKDGELKEPLKEDQKQKERVEKKIELPPPPAFSDFLLSLYASAMMNMGLVEIKGAEKVEIDLPQAKQTIDILEIIFEKTKGNLTEEEKGLFDNILTELRINFVKIMEKL